LDHFQQGESGWRLEQVALKFSLDLEAEAGVVIARAKTSTFLDVTVWGPIRRRLGLSFITS
jgi:hypothetical protein